MLLAMSLNPLYCHTHEVAKALSAGMVQDDFVGDTARAIHVTKSAHQRSLSWHWSILLLQILGSYMPILLLHLPWGLEWN
jgi:hypothetical protein